GILVIGLVSYTVNMPKLAIVQFQVSITYVISLSLIFTGIFQLALTRFAADRLFEKDNHAILPNFHSVSMAVTVVGGVLGLLAV
ncbi:exopolysaccharide Pel transporter PelG, partial [Enterococcus faecium]